MKMAGPSGLMCSGMGYYTNYSLRFEPEESPDGFSDMQEIENFIADPALFSDYETVSDLLRTGCCDDTKWYYWEDDMRVLAHMFPNVLFILSGDGEDSGDVWEFRIKGDQSEYHELTMPPFENGNLFTKKEKELKTN